MPRTLLSLLTLCAIALPSQNGFAQRDLKDIPPPDPELERKTFIVPEGFEVNLYAADPMLAKPIQMNFDELGRLWIASSEVYPQIKPGEKADDKILILEDTDNDGVAENTTVFADGLLIPTGVIPGDGGAYVANSTELLHLTDTDGDGKADRTRVILSGFGTEDTHHILHTLRWGPEGLLYFNQSIYIHSHLETPYGVKRLDAGGIWQFRPETMELDIHMRGLVNSWGHHFDDYGQSFATDGAGGEGINYIVPGAYYFTAVGSNRIIRGLNPGSPKHCGLEIVRSSHLPDDWQGSMLTNDFRGHRVCRFQVSDDGSGFASREQEEVIKSNHVAFRPIDVKVGPDGAVYIADWYNPIIQHGEVDFRDPRRDHTHGRIWRVVNKNKPLLEKPKLAEADNTELLNALKSPEEFTRTHAMRMLRERHLDTGILPSLETWFQNLDTNDPGFESHRLQGLWAYQALNIPASEVLEATLKSRDDRVRAAAVRVIGHWFPSLQNEFDLLSAAVADDSPRVRLEAVRVLGKIGDPRSLEIALRALDREMDSFLDYALWLTCRELRPVWLPELEAGRLAIGTNPAHLIFAFKSLDQNASVAPLVRLLNENKLGPEQTSQIERAIADLGQPPDVKVLFDRLISEQATAAQQLSLLSALSAAANRNVVPPGDLNPAGKLLHAKNPEVVVSACRTIGLWKLASQGDALATLAKDNQAPPAVRDSAIFALAEIGGEIQPLYAALTKEYQPVETRRSAIVAFSDKLPRRAAKDAIALWNAPGGDKQIDPVLSALLQRQNVVGALTEELQSSKLPADTAKLALRVVNSSGRKFDDLVAGFSKAGDIKAGAVVLTKEQMDRMVGLVREQGDPARGEIIFRRNDLACFKCHAIGGAGGKVGPDLISLGASAQPDYIVESLLDPNAKVKENFNTLVVVNDDGKTFSGVKLRQTDTDLVLLDAEDREISIPLASIEDQANGISLMPAGLTEKLTEAELIDLARFLSELGKLGDFAISKAPIARRWQVLIPNQGARYRMNRVGFNVTATDDPELSWQPLYTQVNGDLPREDLLAYNFGENPGRGGTRPIRSADAMAFVRCDLNVTSAGPVELRFNSAKGLTLWINETPTEISSTVLTSLPKGMHRITLAVNLSDRRSENVHLELGQPDGPSAQAQFVSGK